MIARKTVRHIITVDELRALIAATPQYLQIAILLAFSCGLRRSELLGLRRQDIDLASGTLSVSVIRVQPTGSAVTEKRPANPAGQRTVLIPGRLLSRVSHHLDRFVLPEPGARVVVNTQGSPMSPIELTAVWSEIRLRAGLSEPLRLHDLRHSGFVLLELIIRAGHPDAKRERAIAEAFLELMEDKDEDQAEGGDSTK